MNKIFKLFSIGLIALSAVSCDSWLDDVKQTSKVDDVSVFESERTVDLYVDGFYTWLNGYGAFGDKQFSGSLTEAMTDIFKYAGSNQTARAGQPNDYSMLAVPMTVDGGGLYGCWTHAYNCIRRINQFLVLLDEHGAKYPENRIAEWQAQARFFRSFFYFRLARRHGGVILYDALPVHDKARSTEEETWDFIQADFDFAAANLPDAWNAANKGRVTRFAALAMQSRAMLYAQRWQAAFDAADAVVQSGKYQLTPKFTDAYKGGNSESILEYRYSATTGPNHNFDANYVPSTDKSAASCGACPTQEFVECFETADGHKVDWSAWHSNTTTRPPYETLEPRFAATVMYPGCTWKGMTMDFSVQGPNVVYFDYGTRAGGGGETVTGYALRKLIDENHTDITAVKSAQTWVEIRYAEVLLNKAEAAYRLNRISDAQQAMNQVRARVGLPGKDTTGDQWFKDYRNERKIELAFEGHLFWDMNRWRLCHIEYNNYRRHGLKIDNGMYQYVECDNADQMFDQKCYILPIPSDELKNNKLIEQYDNWK